MSVQELEKAVAQLPHSELARFAAWFKEYQSDLSSNRNQFMPFVAQEKMARLGKTRLAQECAKLDPQEEQALADEGLAAEVAQWPPY